MVEAWRNIVSTVTDLAILSLDVNDFNTKRLKAAMLARAPNIVLGIVLRSDHPM